MATGVQGGLVVHLGCGDGQLTAALRAADQAVANPALIAGATGETLLLYEHDEAADRQVIEGRILRRR
jgi:hypothetical protein